jgi:hypothetical protein
MIDCAGYRVRHDKVDKTGTVTLRHNGRLHHIGVGRPYQGWRVVLLVKGLDVQVIGYDASPLRHLRLDPTKDYRLFGFWRGGAALIAQRSSPGLASWACRHRAGPVSGSSRSF